MKKSVIVFLCFFCIVSPLGAAEEVFHAGQGQVSFGLSGQFTEDYSIFYAAADYGYFFSSKFVAGAGLGAHISSNNAVVVEPMAWGRFFVMNRKPLLPFVGLNTGFLYSPEYTYHSDYSVFCDASVDSSFQGDTAKDSLAIWRVTPQIGTYYAIGEKVMMQLTFGYNVLLPVNDSPAEGYTLKRTEYISLAMGISVLL